MMKPSGSAFTASTVMGTKPPAKPDGLQPLKHVAIPWIPPNAQPDLVAAIKPGSEGPASRWQRRDRGGPADGSWAHAEPWAGAQPCTRAHEIPPLARGASWAAG